MVWRTITIHQRETDIDADVETESINKSETGDVWSHISDSDTNSRRPALSERGRISRMQRADRHRTQAEPSNSPAEFTGRQVNVCCVAVW